MNTTDNTTIAPTTITDVSAVAVNVTDQSRAVVFYRDTLGLELRMDADLGGGFRWITVAPPGGHVSIALVAATPATPAGTDTGIRLAAGNADAAHAALVAHSVDVDDVLHWPDVPAMFTFRDLDANTLYVVETPMDVAAS